MSEEWKIVTIAEFADLYEVSNFGEVRSLDRIGSGGRAGKGARHYRGRIMRPHVTRKGYLTIYLRSAPSYRNVQVHRLVAMAFIPNPHGLPEVNHIDCDKTNNRVTNLEWTSRNGNHAHAVKSGLHMACIRKLSDEDVVHIIAMGEMLSHAEIARRYGVNQSTVTRIINGQRRQH
jgi:hypothetical protein